MPDDYFESLGGRIEARLDSADLEGEAMGPNMTTDGGKKNDMPLPGGRPASSPPREKEENTGLHDIKAMATSTKKRISRRMTTESDHEESLLASASSASLAAVVLPEPGKDKEHYADEGSAPRAAAAGTAGLAAADAERSGMPLWIYGVAGAAVAAAAIIFFVVRSGHGNQTEVAQSEAATGTAEATIQQPEEMPAPTAASIPQPSAAGTGDQDLAPPAEDSNGAEAAADQGSSADTDVEATNAATPPAPPPTPAKQDKKAERRSSRSHHATRRSSASSSSSRRAPRAPAARSASHTRKSTHKGGKRSLDDLLNEASGGAVANKDVAAPADKPAEAKKPNKTELSRSDITTGMRKVSARVSACYDKFQQAGTVMVKVSISSDGHVESASATGKFKNTDTGLCVSRAVERAKFPAWDGKIQHINYPFLLSP